MKLDTLFKGLNDSLLWQEKVTTIRQAYGAPESRHVRGSKFRSTYRNAPDGNYVTIQFDTVFESKANGIETIVLQ
jgi:hypothetical protein